jgi:hypothetical protein
LALPSNTSQSLVETSPLSFNSCYVIEENRKPSLQRTSSECKFSVLHERVELTTSAEKIKEDYTYVCQDIVKEFKKYDADPYKYFARFAGEHSVTGRVSVVTWMSLVQCCRWMWMYTR